MVARQPLGHGRGNALGAASDVGAVSLDDAGELHWRRASVSTQPGRFDGQLLHAGEEHRVHAALALEVVAVVLEQPADERAAPAAA